MQIKKIKYLNKQKEANQELVNSFKENVWFSIYKKYESNFKEAFIGFLNKEKLILPNTIFEHTELTKTAPALASTLDTFLELLITQKE